MSRRGTSVPAVILFLLLLIASKTHANQPVGKRPSLTPPVSDNNHNFSMTPFFSFPHHTMVMLQLCLQGGVSEPTLDPCGLPGWEHLSILWLMMHHFSMAQMVLWKGTGQHCCWADISEHRICCNDFFYYLRASGLA